MLSDELKELIARYLRDERERRRIVEAVQCRAYAEHTLERRPQWLLKILGEVRE